MMIYYNANFQFYLENVAPSNINRPAEYRLVAAITGATPSTVKTETIITGTNTLHNYANVDSLYDGTITSLRKISGNAQAGSGNTIVLESGETDKIGDGETIYDSNGVLIGTVNTNGISGSTITLTASPATTITSEVFASQPREATYTNSVVKVSCCVSETGNVKLYLNNKLLTRKKVDLPTSKFSFDASDCFIGQNGTNVNTQFMGELYEISMYNRTEPTASVLSLDPGYSDILFYYRFGDE